MKKMRKWSNKEIEELINSDSFKDHTNNFIKRMDHFDKEKKRKFMDNIDEWIKIINTPMSI